MMASIKESGMGTITAMKDAYVKLQKALPSPHAVSCLRSAALNAGCAHRTRDLQLRWIPTNGITVLSAEYARGNHTEAKQSRLAQREECAVTEGLAQPPGFVCATCF